MYWSLCLYPFPDKYGLFLPDCYYDQLHSDWCANNSWRSWFHWVGTNNYNCCIIFMFDAFAEESRKGLVIPRLLFYFVGCDPGFSERFLWYGLLLSVVKVIVSCPHLCLCLSTPLHSHLCLCPPLHSACVKYILFWVTLWWLYDPSPVPVLSVAPTSPTVPFPIIS